MGLRDITIFNTDFEKIGYVDNLVAYEVAEKRREIGTFSIWVEATPANIAYLQKDYFVQFQFDEQENHEGRNFILESNKEYSLQDTGSYQDLNQETAYKIAADAERCLHERHIVLSVEYTASGASFASGGYCKVILPYKVAGVSKTLEINLTTLVQTNGSGIAQATVLMDTDEVVFYPIQVVISDLKGYVKITHPMLALGTSAVAYAQALEDDMSLKYPNTVWGIIVARNVKDQDDFHGLEITGALLESVLKWRCLWKPYTASGTIPAVFDELLTRNFIAPLDEVRAIPWVTLENAPATMTETVTFEHTGVYVSAQVYAILAMHEVGVKAIYDKYKGQVRFYLYRGKDRSLNQTTLPYVVFSDENGMLVEPKYTEDNGNYKNVALVAGEDTDPSGTNSAEAVYNEAVANGYTGTKEQFFQDVGQPDWSSVRNKPTTFPPSGHFHVWSDITDPPTIGSTDIHVGPDAPATPMLWVDTDEPGQLKWSDITDKPAIEDNLNKSIPGSILDAHQGKLLNDKLAQLSNPNLLINDFQVWQRGTVFTSTGYTADRWYAFYYGGQATTRITNDSPCPGLYALLQYRMSTADYCLLTQPLENSAVYLGKEVTLSFWAKGYSYTGNYEVAIGDTVLVIELTSGWKKYELHVANYVHNLGSVNRRGVTFQKSVGVGQGIYLAGVKLELGSIATPFVPRSFAEELAMCQRYYWESSLLISPSLQAAIQSTITNTIMLPTTMRVAPTVAILDALGTPGYVTRAIAGVATYDGQQMAVGGYVDSIYVRSDGTASANQIRCYAKADAEIY